MSKNELKEASCQEWTDVRSFGQVFAFNKGKEGVSMGIRGPVSVHQSISASPVNIESMPITKSVNGKLTESGEKATDTMGTKHFINFGLYKIKGSINCQLAEKTGFTYEDAQKVKEALKTLFENDSSAARPEGSMEVYRLYWWEHEEKMPKASTAKVHKSVKIKLKEGIELPESVEDYIITLENPENCVEPEIV